MASVMHAIENARGVLQCWFLVSVLGYVALPQQCRVLGYMFCDDRILSTQIRLNSCYDKGTVPYIHQKVCPQKGGLTLFSQDYAHNRAWQAENHVVGRCGRDQKRSISIRHLGRIIEQKGGV